MGAKEFGARVFRTEDEALITGHGRYVADIAIPGTLHAAFVRSHYGHARIRSIDTRRASALPGVVAVLTLADLPPRMRAPIPMGTLIPPIVKTEYPSEKDVTQHALAADEVCYVGQTIAAVIAENRYIAEDAADLVEVDYEELPAIADIHAAVGANPIRVHSALPGNVACRLKLEKGDVEAAFRSAAGVYDVSLKTHRGNGGSIEGRAVLAVPDPAEDRLTIWSACQTPHNNQKILAHLLGRDLESIRVVAPDVGGGFGPKAPFYAEEAVVAAAALKLGRPVRWIEDRREHFLSTTREGDQFWEASIALDRDGRILGVRANMIHDNGAYLPLGIIAPHTAAATMHGPYVIPNLLIDVTVGFTNTVPNAVVRGAGRLQGVFAMERLIDRAADGSGIDRAELRWRNLIQPEQMPYSIGLVYRHGETITYDSGDYPACQAKALEMAGYAGFAERREAALKDGRYIGIGVANFVEGTGLGPFESATVRLLPGGKVRVNTGISPQGQGHKTTMAQVCADQLGVAIGDITVVCGDTGAISMGVGTVSSRSGANGGSAVYQASAEVRSRLLKIAARNLEALEGDLELAGGKAQFKDAPESGIGFDELLRIAMGGGRFGGWMAKGIAAGLEATSYFTPPQSTFCNGTHVATVEVDIATGLVRMVDYVVAHDCGNMINPIIVDGQVQGGVAHGIGNALFELMAYDDQAQPISANFADYLLPTAADVPTARLAHLCSPTPINPLGVKGAGEGGTIPAPAAIASAIENALEPFGIRIDGFPISPARIIELLRGSAGSDRWRGAMEAMTIA